MAQDDSLEESDGNTWVGPTKCGPKRDSRQAELDKIWDMIKPMLQPPNFKIATYMITGLSLDLFREAMNCYQNGAYLATCAMCRTCCESLVYLATTRKVTSIKHTENINEHYVREKRTTFLKTALEYQILDHDDGRTIERIWKKGDFAMHLHQKTDINRNEWARLVSMGRIPDGNMLKGWSDVTEARDALESTAKIISKVLARLNATMDDHY